MSEKKTVLFICTHNSARSQMAEAFLRAFYGDRFEAFSAGTKPTRLHPMAIQVMAERGIDIANQRSKPLIEFFDRTIDLAVTICDDAQATCPMVPGARKVLHKGFEDPAEATGPDNEIQSVFRKARDEIGAWVKEYFENPV